MIDEQEFEKIRLEVATLTSQMTGMITNIADIQKSSNEVGSKVFDLSNRLETLESEHKTLARNFTSFKTQTQNKLQELTSEVEEMEKDIKEKILPEIDTISKLEGDGTETPDGESEFIGSSEDEIYYQQAISTEI